MTGQATEMPPAVAEQFFAWSDMKEQRDAARNWAVALEQENAQLMVERDERRGRAEVAEAELAAALALLNPARNLDVFATHLAASHRFTPGPVQAVRLYLNWCAGGES